MAEMILKQARFGETMRKDIWWAQPVAVFTGLTLFIAYAMWAAFQGAHYHFEHYLSPFFAPVIYGDGPHAWIQGKPSWWPSWIIYSPSFLVAPFPLLFRLTCYYYRGSYYKSFWADPPACAVGEPRTNYRGEKKFPLVMMNLHRYFLIIGILFAGLLAYDAIRSLWHPVAGGGEKFGLAVGNIVLAVNIVFIMGYTFGCHSMRHLVGGVLDQFTGRPVRKIAWECVTCLNKRHMIWAWASLLWVGATDVYIRLCSMGVITDYHLF